VEELTRRERKRLQKRKARARGIVLLACLLLFLIGVAITYDTMQEVMHIKKHNSIFSFGNSGQTLKELTGEIPDAYDRIRNTLVQWFAKVRLALDGLWRWFGALISS
jgi:predicted PurR-regulated permease PerM